MAVSASLARVRPCVSRQWKDGTAYCVLSPLQVAVVILSWSGSDPTEHIELAHALRVARILRILRVREGMVFRVLQCCSRL